MQVNGPSHVHGSHNLKGPHYARSGGSQPARPSATPTDQLDISPAAEAAIQATENGSIRADLVARVRSEIASGSYETPDKLDAALDRVLDELG